MEDWIARVPRTGNQMQRFAAFTSAEAGEMKLMANFELIQKTVSLIFLVTPRLGKEEDMR